MNRRSPKPRFLTEALLAGLLLSSGPCALAADQTSYYLNGGQTSDNGSNASMQVSTTYAMTALMNLASMNIPSAVNNGMTAYGKYRNAETLDRMTSQNVASAQGMASVGSTSASTSSGISAPPQTSFRRLDPAFLQQGEANTVATEFEKESGMPRTQFLSALSSISEQKISKNDPQMVDKALSRLESFISTVPNAQFRGNLQKAVDMVPATVRTGLVSKAVAKFAGMMAAGGSTSPADAKAAAAADDAAKAAAAAAKDAAGPAPDADRVPASEVATADSSVSNASHDGEKDPLGGIVQAAISSQDQNSNLTIFQQVSRFYRSMHGYFGPKAKP